MCFVFFFSFFFFLLDLLGIAIRGREKGGKEGMVEHGSNGCLHSKIEMQSKRNRVWLGLFGLCVCVEGNKHKVAAAASGPVGLAMSISVPGKGGFRTGEEHTVCTIFHLAAGALILIWSWQCLAWVDGIVDGSTTGLPLSSRLLFAEAGVGGGKDGREEPVLRSDG